MSHGLPTLIVFAVGYKHRATGAHAREAVTHSSLSLSLFSRHRALVHGILPGNLRPLREDLHVGLEVDCDGPGGA